jgi:hypothetical protein
MSKELSTLFIEILRTTLKAGKNLERAKIFEIIEQISCSNEIGTYVYIDDLKEYLREADNIQAEKRTNKW